MVRTLTGGNGAAVLAVTLAVSVAVVPAAFLATSVNVVDVVALTVIVVEPLRLRAVPLMVADAALVVCQVTSAVVALCLVAVMVAVGAAAGTVAVSVAVVPAAFLATSVNVVDVVALTVIVVEPLRLRAVPLMVADAALVVCQVTSAVVGLCLVAVMVAVGAAAATVAVSVAVVPAAFLATSVNVVDVVALTVLVAEPFKATAAPLRVADVALVVCQVTSAVVGLCLVAVMVAVGAAAGTVAVSVAVVPAAFLATSVNVVDVVALTVLVAEPLRLRRRH